jgi:hypothetical protein
MVRIELHEGYLREIDLDPELRTADLLQAQRVGLVYPASTPLSTASQALIEEIKRECETTLNHKRRKTH